MNSAAPDTDVLQSLDWDVTVPCSCEPCPNEAAWLRLFPCGHWPWPTCHKHKAEQIAHLREADADPVHKINLCTTCHIRLTTDNVRWEPLR